MRWSARIPADLAVSRLHRRLEALGDLTDLTAANPTTCGLAWPRQALARALDGGEARQYEPEALGPLSARQLLAAHLLGEGQPAAADRLALTASTSEAYAVLFKLLCDPGDAIAVPAPSYPLIEELARLEAVRTLPYRLLYDGHWRLDLDSLRVAIDTGARAVIIVQPNNPTGSVLRDDDRQALRTMCAAADVPIIADEVFRPYGFARTLPSLAIDDGPLTFLLDGLSKRVGLPQMKLGWIGLYGGSDAVAEARQRLSHILDAYLSVGAPVLASLPALLADGEGVQKAIRARVRENRRVLAQAMAALPPVDLLEADGGWYAVLRVPRTASDDELVLALAEEARVRLHPGYFYDFAGEGYLVATLLLQPEPFAEAVSRLSVALARRFAEPV